MKCNITGIDGFSTLPPVVEVSHNGETLLFSAAPFGRTSFSPDWDVFDHINKYWATQTQEVQDKIFGIYRDVAEIFSASMNQPQERSQMTSQLNKKVIELMEVHDFESAHQWLLYSSDVCVQDNFKREYVHSVDHQGSREQTYIRSDYTKLLTFTLIMRSMIPIWGEFIAGTRKQSGTLYKEYYAFHLLSHSKILHTEAYEKLMMYIDRTVGEDRLNPSTIIKGISSEDFTMWIMAQVVINKLCVSDIRGIDPKATLVSTIHRYVSSKIKGSDAGPDLTVKEKLYDEGNDGMESKLSALERYKIKHEISLGEIVELEWSITDTRRIAHRLSSKMTDELLDMCMATAQQLQNKQLLDPQVTLLCWVMKPVISPRGLMYLDHSILVKMFGVAQAVLWARGHRYLSLLLTSYTKTEGDETYLSGTDSRQRIPKDLLAELDVLYPYKNTEGGRKNGPKIINRAVEAIDTLAANLSTFSWWVTADERLVREELKLANLRRIPIPSDIKIKLATLVVELGRRNWT